MNGQATGGRLSPPEIRRPVWWTLLGLVILNLLLWIALEGLLAWQTHLGGFAAGWLGAALLARLGGSGKRHP